MRILRSHKKGCGTHKNERNAEGEKHSVVLQENMTERKNKRERRSLVLSVAKFFFFVSPSSSWLQRWLCSHELLVDL